MFEAQSFNIDSHLYVKMHFPLKNERPLSLSSFFFRKDGKSFAEILLEGKGV